MLTPVKGKIIIKYIEPDKTTSGGIVLTSATAGVPQIAEVIAVNPDDSILSVGEKVIVAKYAGAKIDYAGEQYLCASIGDVLATLD